jgi:hypothetical protein
LVGLLWTSDEFEAETRNIHNGKISMLPAGFEPAFKASERWQTYGLDRSVTVIATVQVQK